MGFAFNLVGILTRVVCATSVSYSFIEKWKKGFHYRGYIAGFA